MLQCCMNAFASGKQVQRIGIAIEWAATDTRMYRMPDSNLALGRFVGNPEIGEVVPCSFTPLAIQASIFLRNGRQAVGGRSQFDHKIGSDRRKFAFLLAGQPGEALAVHPGGVGRKRRAVGEQILRVRSERTTASLTPGPVSQLRCDFHVPATGLGSAERRDDDLSVGRSFDAAVRICGAEVVIFVVRQLALGLHRTAVTFRPLRPAG